jgi:bifunctional UDP-N-acetylglucosamine pyrophosphorylase/glucosamine-1-phosphate N-acetyltransferase
MTGETMTKRPLACVILAAGRGVRMKSKKPKVMNELLGWPMIKWLLESVRHLEPERTIVVVGPGMEDLVEAVHPCEAVLQPQQDGTGSALKCAMNLLQKFNGDVLVLLGDTPMISRKPSGT